MGVPGWLAAPEDRAVRLAERLGMRASPAARPGPTGSEHRRKFVARAAAHLTRALADEAGTHLAVRARGGAEPEEIVVAYPWRRRGAAEAFGREVAGLFRQALTGRRSMERTLTGAA